MLMRQQDSTLGVISGTLSNLASQAGLIGQEVNEHNVSASCAMKQLTSLA